MSFRQRLRPWALVVALLAVPNIALAVLLTFPGLDVRWFSAGGHLVVVSAIAACALVVAAGAVTSALRAPQAGVVWLALGCSLVGLLMLGHGLTTPGALGQPANEWVRRLPYLALAGFAVCLWIAGRRPDQGRRDRVARHPLAAVGLPLVPALALVAVVVADPAGLHGAAPVAHEGTLSSVLAMVVIACAAVALVRHSRRWQLGRDPVQLALVLAAAMSIAAVLAFEFGRFPGVSWWDYHAYLLAGFGAGVYALVVRGRRGRAIAEALTDTFDDDLFAHIVRGYPEALSTLVKAVEVKDTYTHGHSTRTAELAVEIGVAMSLPPDRLRVIARGAHLHDLGKIAIPDDILNKPGPLTPHEREVVEQHPRLGYELAATAPSLREVLPVILYHHERLDGRGYPEGRGGASLPLEARVVSVADVWDALTSDRAYRRGWAPAAALAHIQAGRGTHFDPAVVDALVWVLGDRGVGVAATGGRAEEAWLAAETCHQIDAVAGRAAVPSR